MNKIKYLLALALTTGAAFAQGEDPTIPSVSDMQDNIEAISGLAAVAAVLGLSIWAYRKAKAKAGQAIG